MKYYCGNGKPYIYVSFTSENQEMATDILEQLSLEDVLFWHGDKINNKELKRIEGAHAVLLFVTGESFKEPDFHTIVNHAVRCNKSILTIYTEGVQANAWAHMQLDSAQALFMKEYETQEAFLAKLKESQIFRNMEVTKQQRRFKRNTTLSAVFIPLASAAIIFALVVYPLLIAPSVNNTEDTMEIYGLDGLTQEELDAITDINIMGDKVFTDVNDVGIGMETDNGELGYMVDFSDGTEESGSITRGQISDLSDLTKCRNLKVLRICGNNISDLSPLAELPKLERIVLEENPIGSLKGLEKLDNVWELSINYTDVSDLTPIEDWKNLRVLCIKFTPVEALPDTGLMEHLDFLTIEGTLVKEVPYLGTGREKHVDVHRLPTTLEDLSFLRDIESYWLLSIDNASSEKLRPVLEGKVLNEFDDSGINVTSLKELDWLTIAEGGRLDVCNSDKLVSLEGIEHFEGIGTLCVKGCRNLEDLTPCLRLKSLEDLQISSDMRPLAESQLQGAPFEVSYWDD